MTQKRMPLLFLALTATAMVMACGDGTSTNDTLSPDGLTDTQPAPDGKVTPDTEPSEVADDSDVDTKDDTGPGEVSVGDTDADTT